jgi:hypothetical protein
MQPDKRLKNAAGNCKTIEELQIQIAVLSSKQKVTLKKYIHLQRWKQIEIKKCS